MGQYVEHIPFKQVIELDWYESFTNGPVKFTALPVVHFSARSLTDTDESGPLFQQEAVRMGIAKKYVWVMKIGETKIF